jgi:glycerol-3-phosphate dehydrogenase
MAGRRDDHDRRPRVSSIDDDIAVIDIAVIGGGVVGCAVARELAGHELAGREVSVALVEARADVGDATSKANTAILHTGFDAVPGSLESGLVAEGYRLLGAYAEQVGIPVERTGALLVAWTSEELDALPGLRAKAVKNGYDACQIVDAAEVYRREPRLGGGVMGGLAVPGESIICPWTTTLAYATEAQARGAQILLSRRVTGIDVGRETTTLHTTRGPVTARWVINAAGLGADVLDRLYGYQRFTVVPRRGELLVFDKLSRRLVNSIVLPVPSSKGKGVLISPTIFGNVMLGPTSENLEDRTDTSTSKEGFEFLLAKGRALMPSLLDEEVTTAYAGLRAATEHSDYVVDVNPFQRYVLLGGIRSTGLTSSMAIGGRVVDLLRGVGLDLSARASLPDAPVMPNLGEAFPRPYQREDLIDSDPQYGSIVCFCERVTHGEIRDALRSSLPPSDLDGLRRRTRAAMGRCQGFYCGAEVDALLRGRGGA